MGRRKLRMFKSSKDKEAKFIACLLALGPPPNARVSPTVSTNPREIVDYRDEVKAWWASSHTKCLPPITDKGLHRFYNRYKRWLAQQRYHQRHPTPERKECR